MTKKRFTVFGEWHKDNVIDEIRDNTGEFVTIGRCVDLLNENEQLKQYIKTLGLGISKILETIKNDKEDKAMIMCIELLKKLEEMELLE